MTEHTTIAGKLIAGIGNFFAHIFEGAKKGFEDMPKADQDNVIAGVNIAQIIKENYTKGEDAVVSLIVDKTGIPKDVVEQGILTIAKDAGINTTSVQSYLDTIADKIQAGITDNHWNALWENVAKFAASFLSDGKLNWVTLGMGVIQFALQAIVKK